MLNRNSASGLLRKDICMKHSKGKLLSFCLLFLVSLLFIFQMNNETKTLAQKSAVSNCRGGSPQTANLAKASLKISAEVLAADDGKKQLALKYVLQNLISENLIVFDAQQSSQRQAVYVVPKENGTVEIGQYLPPLPKGATGPYVPRTEFSAVLLKPKQRIEESLEINYPLIVNDPSDLSLLFANEKLAVSPLKIRFCLGIASTNGLTKSERGRQKNGIYSASLAEAARQEIICSDIVAITQPSK